MANASPIRCLVTAGPTREFLDPVRFISNPSSGKMGFAVAEAAVELGWTVDLVAGPVALEEPPGAILYPVVTAEEMFHQVDALFDASDILIMAAAVSDFRPAQTRHDKEKKSGAELRVDFEPTVDILQTVGERRVRQTMVGFAAETRNLETHARQKLEAKRLDWIVANRVGAEGNEVLLLGADGGCEKIGPDSKKAVARELLKRFAATVGAGARW